MNDKLNEFYIRLQMLLEDRNFVDLIDEINKFLGVDGWGIPVGIGEIALIGIYKTKDNDAMYIEITLVSALKILVICREKNADKDIHCTPFAYPPTATIASTNR